MIFRAITKTVSIEASFQKVFSLSGQSAFTIELLSLGSVSE